MYRCVKEGEALMNDFIFYNPVRIYFGEHQLQYLKEELKKYGRNVLFAYGGASIKRTGLYDEIYKLLDGFTLYELSGIEPNPDIESVRTGAEICRKNNIDVILAAGGGSVIDASKWIAAASCVEHDAWDFFCKKTDIRDALPVITIPTLAATGSEMNHGGVISNRAEGKKIGRTSPYLFPKASFLNPAYTFSVSPYQTACGIVDILSHVMEVYFHHQEPFEMLDGMMESMIQTVMNHAVIALDRPDHYEARANLMWAASWSINGFINGGIKQAWNCHTIEHELSARYNITHGHGMAILLPAWLRYCFCEETKNRYYKFAEKVLNISTDQDEELILNKITDTLRDFFFVKLKLEPKLEKLGIKWDDLELISDELCKNGPIQGFANLEREDVLTILQACY